MNRSTLTAAFAAAAAANPDALAVETAGGSCTYARLDAWSDAVGARLRADGVRRGDHVALRTAPGAGALAAMLGILKAGAAYVPLDVRNPPARNAFILADSRATAFVGDPGDGPGDGPRAAGIPLLADAELDALAAPDPATPTAVPDAAATPGPQDTAYVIYTSGTTGRPKGVPVRHESVAALFDAAAALFDFTSDDRWLLFHSLGFDFSVWEIWGALTTGATLVVPEPGATRSPYDTLRAVAEHGVSVLNQTPTAFAGFAAAALEDGHPLPALRHVVFGGERLDPASLRAWAQRYGVTGPRLVNMYGITETTVHATFHALTEADLDGAESPIGLPLPSFTARVVAGDGEEAADGEEGELWLAGPQVTAGYLDRPELDAERFAPLPGPGDAVPRRHYRSGDLVARRPDGVLVYRGRADLQVKLRGHRVELGDVESAVRSHPGVADAVVWPRTHGPGDERLVCAWTPAAAAPAATPGHAATAAALRAHVGALLPAYMHPAEYRPLAELPRTVNGKTDRAAVATAWEGLPAPAAVVRTPAPTARAPLGGQPAAAVAVLGHGWFG
ncbi:amino acid adenylation domain-containing protein [Streptomyces sp. NPDC002044]|uniref:amino acid adenylation domain-containing protein n=1 Tax=Streptomyces sp. NPDC002044 TaxID=3154662 RepID=UPI00331FBC0B